jgi:hypothetical protein
VSAKSIVRELVPPVLWRILSKIKGRIQGPSPSLPHPPVDPWRGRESEAGLLGPDDRRFIETRLSELTGWLDANAAYFTAYMLNAQHAANIKGPVLEIGVFAGKFLMLLHYLGRRHGTITVGVDIFTDSRPEPILRHAEALFGTCRREAHDFYLQAGRNFSQDCADLEIVKRFLLRRTDGVHWVEQDLLGVKTLIYA